jgi:hypothetical protein
VKRRCIEPDCLELTTRTRCPACQRDYMLGRGYTSEYKHAHAQARRTLTPQVLAGVDCTRCNTIVTSTMQWDADQRPFGWAVAHSSCNRKAGARREA